MDLMGRASRAGAFALAIVLLATVAAVALLRGERGFGIDVAGEIELRGDPEAVILAGDVPVSAPFVLVDRATAERIGFGSMPLPAAIVPFSTGFCDRIDLSVDIGGNPDDLIVRLDVDAGGNCDDMEVQRVLGLPIVGLDPAARVRRG